MIGAKTVEKTKGEDGKVQHGRDYNSVRPGDGWTGTFDASGYRFRLHGDQARLDWELTTALCVQ